MAQSFNLPARTLQTGDTVFGPFAVPIGTSNIAMTLDITQMTINQVVWVHVEFFDGADWFGGLADMVYLNPETGLPYTNKRTGLPITQANLNFGTSKLSTASWQVRATFTVENGPFTTSGGTLTIT